MSRLSTSHDLLQSRLSISTADFPQTQTADWGSSIPGISRVIRKLGVSEFRRRLFHMTPALLPAVLPFLDHPDPWGMLLMGAVATIAVVVIVLSIVLAPYIKRNGETDWRYAVWGYMIPVIAPILLFPDRAEWGLMTLQILALGDGSATLGGLMFGGRRLPWNPRKTVAGLICFTMMGAMGATLSFWAEALPGVPFGIAFAICGTASLCAGLVESLPIRSNDNFRVGMSALLSGIFMTMLLT
ncbi:hypothetical protein [Schlesneria sp. T3-172]|uniref:hypothetical protein n=1 Tax=Schlesneria sphaerica TaxID=3373610 RepID=UPI0037C84544